MNATNRTGLHALLAEGGQHAVGQLEEDIRLVMEFLEGLEPGILLRLVNQSRTPKRMLTDGLIRLSNLVDVTWREPTGRVT